MESIPWVRCASGNVYNDGMVMFFFQGTIAIDGFFNGFTIPGPSPLNVFHRSTIDIDGFSMVFSNSGAMVSVGFDLEKNLKMPVIFFTGR